MEKVNWKANQVISIETKRKDESRNTNIYVLAQMINKSQLLIFDLFNTDNDWSNVRDLSNERLYLCYKMGRNIDPLKDLTFNLPIPKEYKEYIDIISS